MPTLYVENVPDDLYKALRKRAKDNRRSLAAEVITLLEEQVPTAAELKRRHGIVSQFRQLQATTPSGLNRFQTSDELVREDRER